MSRKSPVLWIGVVVALSAGLWYGRRVARASLPRPLPKGQCTWYAAERVQDDGWTLVFDTNAGRHAKAWPQKVQNATLAHEPVAGSILVLDAWKGNPYGHVGYVESMGNNGDFDLTHANFKRGEVCDTRDGVTVYRAHCHLSNNSVVVADGTPLPMLGFLVRK